MRCLARVVLTFAILTVWSCYASEDGKKDNACCKPNNTCGFRLSPSTPCL